VTAIVHLYWLYTQPRCFDRIRLGYTMCGERLPREKMTRFVDDATCPACLQRVTQKENAPAADRGAVGEPHMTPSLVIRNREPVTMIHWGA